MSSPAIELTPDVISYVGSVFDHADEEVTSRLDRMPTTHEETLDFSFIDALILARGPHVTSSGTVVDIDAHFLGGGWHVGRWEIADIGLIVVFRRGQTLLKTKVVLLQSKRLYPREAEFVEDLGMARPGGFGSLMLPSLPATMGSRLFRFDETCRYKALQVGDEQWQAIGQYEVEFGLPIHYMLYHPRRIPSESKIPVQAPVETVSEPIEIGSRVLSAANIRALTGGFSRNYAPSFGDLCDHEAAPGVSLSDFVVDGVLGCREGYVTEKGVQDRGLQRVFNQRSGPIAAAVRIDIILPD